MKEYNILLIYKFQKKLIDSITFMSENDVFSHCPVCGKYIENSELIEYLRARLELEEYLSKSNKIAYLLCKNGKEEYRTRPRLLHIRIEELIQNLPPKTKSYRWI